MSPIAALSNSTSSIAMATSLGQVIQFPTRAPAPVEAIDAPVAEITPAAQNDNVAADVIEEGPDDVDGDDSPVPFSSRNATFERAALARAVEIASEVVERRNTIPILSNIRIAQRNGRAVLTATDLDVEVQVSLPASIDTGFSTTLPADLLKKLLKGAKSSDFVTIDTGEYKDSLDFERAVYQLQSLPAVDFPDLLKPGEKANVFTMPGKIFAEAMETTIGATSSEETRYYLCGVFMRHEYDGNRNYLACIATDGHRLNRKRMELPAGAEQMPEVIVPTRMVSTLCRLMRGKHCPESVTIAVDTNRISVSFDDVSVVSKLVDGTYPDYQRVVPARNSHFAVMDAAAMVDAISAVNVLSTTKGRAVKLEIGGGECRVIVNDPETGSAMAKLPCSYDGDSIEVGYNSGYLVDAVKTVMADGKDFTLNIEDHASPALITGSREDFISVLMPMRI
jgi:DNA polymerase III subunit beta